MHEQRDDYLDYEKQAITSADHSSIEYDNNSKMRFLIKSAEESTLTSELVGNQNAKFSQRIIVQRYKFRSDYNRREPKTTAS